MSRDLPLEGTPSTRFLLWVQACLVGLCVLALALAAMGQARVSDLARHPAILTVALPPPEPGAPEDGAAGRVLALLREVPGVAFAAPVPEAEVARLVEPWIGRHDGPPLPLPRLIDVTMLGGVAVDRAAMELRLQEAVPEVSLAQSGRAGGGIAASRLLRDIAAAAALLLLAACGVATAWLTRLSLDLHAGTIELLRLMGAAERYVTRQYERHALATALQGGLAGLCAALVPLLALQHVPGLAALAVAPMGEGAWLALAAVPLAGALLATLAARAAARHGLRRLG